MTEKTCKQCGTTKPIDDFYPDRNNKSGRDAWCKECRKRKSREYAATRPTRYQAPEGMKRCQRCKATKPLGSFPKNRSRFDGYGPYCKDCANALRAEFSRDHPGLDVEYHRRGRARNPQRHADYGRKQRFGMAFGEYERMLVGQEGRCAICRTTEPGAGRKSFHVDHCHLTGRVRGLLCHDCNLGLGHFRDDPTFLLAAIDYLK